MKRLSLGYTVLGLSVLALASCASDETTAPTETPTAAGPELAVAHNTWLTRKDMWNTERTDFATATVPNAAGQSVVYVIGGRGASNVGLTSVMAYNVATNIWTLTAPLPRPRYGMNKAGVINGKIYVAGGYSTGYSMGQLYMYDPAKNSWVQKSEMPFLYRDADGVYQFAGGGGVAGVIGGSLYVLAECVEAQVPNYDNCGSSGPYMPDLLFRYNPVTDRWTKLASPPGNGFYVGLSVSGMAGVIGGKLYVVGRSGGLGRLAVYDPSTNTWTAKRGLGQYRYGAASVVHAGKLYLVGGTRVNADGSKEVLRANIAYDPTTDRWINYAPLPTARTGLGGSLVTLNGQPRIEVVGGSRPGNNLQYIP